MLPILLWVRARRFEPSHYGIRTGRLSPQVRVLFTRRQSVGGMPLPRFPGAKTSVDVYGSLKLKLLRP